MDDQIKFSRAKRYLIRHITGFRDGAEPLRAYHGVGYDAVLYPRCALVVCRKTNVTLDQNLVIRLMEPNG